MRGESPPRRRPRPGRWAPGAPAASSRRRPLTGPAASARSRPPGGCWACCWSARWPSPPSRGSPLEPPRRSGCRWSRCCRGCQCRCRRRRCSAVGPLGQLLAAACVLASAVAGACRTAMAIGTAGTSSAIPVLLLACALQRVGVVGVAAHPRRRRAALPDHHAEPAGRRRPADRGQPSTARVRGLRGRRAEAGLPAARARWRDLLDSRARRLGARAAGLLCWQAIPAPCSRWPCLSALGLLVVWRSAREVTGSVGRSRRRHGGRRAVGPVLLPDVHDLSRRAGGRRGRRGGLARARRGPGRLTWQRGAGVRSAAGRPALAAHALRRPLPVRWGWSWPDGCCGRATRLGALAVARCARWLRSRCRRC